MRQSPRARQLLKWGAAGGLAAVLLVWTASGWWYCWWIGTYSALNVSGGQIGVAWFGPGHGVEPGWTLVRTPQVDLWPEPPNVGRVGGTTSSWYVSIPLWMLAIPLALLTGLTWRRDAIARRLARMGMCPNCDYDRSGLAADALCPECGAPPLASSQSAQMR